ncbi:histone acetyltransferase [Achlya hypogyna]|uniref:histone acetyltransferase n=1 Tax=Achlya hypogyna TaxID=1202772 RepID=A0A1V9ZLF8_ACHHY|nr:histone acetyltransferase [Achlya hypogyna]
MMATTAAEGHAPDPATPMKPATTSNASNSDAEETSTALDNAEAADVIAQTSTRAPNSIDASGDVDVGEAANNDDATARATHLKSSSKKVSTNEAGESANDAFAEAGAGTSHPLAAADTTIQDTLAGASSQGNDGHPEAAQCPPSSDVKAHESLKRKRSEDVTPTAIVSRDEMAKKEEDGGLLEFDVITNDGTPERMIQLMTLKNIFSKQLPKMPKEYIVRLVFDRNHHSMVILKNKKHVVGGICYRPFLANHFGEIAFCAITASEQVKGYGTRLMNHLKEYVKTQGITHFLTYADNYAIGYFKKQGFSKIVSMPKSNWFGYIKDYDGGTLMECCIHTHINYLDITSMVQQQRKMIMEKIQARSKAHVVYPGLTTFCEARLVDVYSVPGVKEAGWSQTIIRNNRIGSREPGSLKAQLQALWKSLSNHRSAWPFHEPVDTKLVTDYLDIVKTPVDLTSIHKRIDENGYANKAAFKADLMLMCDNCMLYNSSETNYYKAAKDLLEYVHRKVEIDDAGPAYHKIHKKSTLLSR